MIAPAVLIKKAMHEIWESVGVGPVDSLSNMVNELVRRL